MAFPPPLRTAPNNILYHAEHLKEVRPTTSPRISFSAQLKSAFAMGFNFAEGAKCFGIFFPPLLLLRSKSSRPFSCTESGPTSL